MKRYLTRVLIICLILIIPLTTFKSLENNISHLNQHHYNQISSSFIIKDYDKTKGEQVDFNNLESVKDPINDKPRKIYRSENVSVVTNFKRKKTLKPGSRSWKYVKWTDDQFLICNTFILSKSSKLNIEFKYDIYLEGFNPMHHLNTDFNDKMWDKYRTKSEYRPHIEYSSFFVETIRIPLIHAKNKENSDYLTIFLFPKELILVEKGANIASSGNNIIYYNTSSLKFIYLYLREFKGVRHFTNLMKIYRFNRLIEKYRFDSEDYGIYDDASYYSTKDPNTKPVEEIESVTFKDSYIKDFVFYPTKYLLPSLNTSHTYSSTTPLPSSSLTTPKGTYNISIPDYDDKNNKITRNYPTYYVNIPEDGLLKAEAENKISINYKQIRDYDSCELYVNDVKITNGEFKAKKNTRNIVKLYKIIDGVKTLADYMILYFYEDYDPLMLKSANTNIKLSELTTKTFDENVEIYQQFKVPVSLKITNTKNGTTIYNKISEFHNVSVGGDGDYKIEYELIDGNKHTANFSIRTDLPTETLENLKNGLKDDLNEFFIASSKSWNPELKRFDLFPYKFQTEEDAIKYAIKQEEKDIEDTTYSGNLIYSKKFKEFANIFDVENAKAGSKIYLYMYGGLLRVFFDKTELDKVVADVAKQSIYKSLNGVGLNYYPGDDTIPSQIPAGLIYYTNKNFTLQKPKDIRARLAVDGVEVSYPYTFNKPGTYEIREFYTSLNNSNVYKLHYITEAPIVLSDNSYEIDFLRENGFLYSTSQNISFNIFSEMKFVDIIHEYNNGSELKSDKYSLNLEFENKLNITLCKDCTNTITFIDGLGNTRKYNLYYTESKLEPTLYNLSNKITIETATLDYNKIQGIQVQYGTLKKPDVSNLSASIDEAKIKSTDIEWTTIRYNVNDLLINDLYKLEIAKNIGYYQVSIIDYYNNLTHFVFEVFEEEESGKLGVVASVPITTNKNYYGDINSLMVSFDRNNFGAIDGITNVLNSIKIDVGDLSIGSNGDDGSVIVLSPLDIFKKPEKEESKTETLEKEQPTLLPREFNTNDPYIWIYILLGIVGSIVLVGGTLFIFKRNKYIIKE